jgi:hypothetical protein
MRLDTNLNVIGEDLFDMKSEVTARMSVWKWGMKGRGSWVFPRINCIEVGCEFEVDRLGSF